MSEHLRRIAVTDLYLTLSCEVGNATAWERLTREYGPRLMGLAVRRGADPGAAETHVGDLLSDLACPPPNGAARTLIGTFDGAGSLFGWLAVILGRRIARSRAVAREVSRASLGSSLGAEESMESEVAASTPGPVECVAAMEAAMRLSGVLREAWNDLTPGESLAVLSKYRDGLEQQQIARLLRVSDSRVSRVVGRAHEKLALAVRRLFAKEGTADAATWSALCSVVSKHLSSAGPATPPPAVPDPGADGGSPAAGGTP